MDYGVLLACQDSQIDSATFSTVSDPDYLVQSLTN
jgi:hypothetical protein